MQNSSWKIQVDTVRLSTQLFPKNCNSAPTCRLYRYVYRYRSILLIMIFLPSRRCGMASLQVAFKNIRTDCLYRTWPCVSIIDHNDFPLAGYQAINHLLIKLGFFKFKSKRSPAGWRTG